MENALGKRRVRLVKETIIEWNIAAAGPSDSAENSPKELDYGRLQRGR